MKYGNYNYLDLEINPTTATTGTFTKETANRINAAGNGTAKIKMGDKILYPVLFSVEGKIANFRGVSSSQTTPQPVIIIANLTDCTYSFKILN